MSTLFPELDAIDKPALHEWSGRSVNKYGSPRVHVRILAIWHQHHGWMAGWFAQVDKALDEWHPSNPNAWRAHPGPYPWYRLDELPRSRQHDIAAGNAARAVKIVLEQMKAYAEDEAATQDTQQLQDDIERQARAWLTGNTC